VQIHLRALGYDGSHAMVYLRIVIIPAEKRPIAHLIVSPSCSQIHLVVSNEVQLVMLYLTDVVGYGSTCWR